MPISTINTNSISDDAVTVPKVADQVLTHRNLVINGDMQCWQRATAATTAVNTAYQTVDRYAFGENTDGTYTTEQSTDTPTGAGYSLKLQVTGADTSLAASQYAYIYQPIEAQNLQQLNYGTSGAKTLTLSFWVKSSKTGIYTVSLYKQDTTGYHFTQEYTISSANTWEKKTITITPTAGSTSFITSSGGAITNDNGAGLFVNFNLAFGSTFNGGTSGSWSSDTADYSTTNAVNWMDSTSNDFYLTGVQLEVGETATPFEHRSYGEELALCQRYFQGQGTTAAAMDAGGGAKQTQLFYSSSLSFSSGATHRLQLNMQRSMRAAPTVYISDNNGNLGKAYWTTVNTTASTYTATSFSVALLLTAITTSTTTDMWVNYSLEAEL